MASPDVRHCPNRNKLGPSASSDSKATQEMGGWEANSSVSAKDGAAATSSSASAATALASFMVVIGWCTNAIHFVVRLHVVRVCSGPPMCSDILHVLRVSRRGRIVIVGSSAAAFLVCSSSKFCRVGLAGLAGVLRPF